MWEPEVWSEGRCSGGLGVCDYYGGCESGLEDLWGEMRLGLGVFIFCGFHVGAFFCVTRALTLGRERTRRCPSLTGRERYRMHRG